MLSLSEQTASLHIHCMQCCSCVCALEQDWAERRPAPPLTLIETETETVQMKYIQWRLRVFFHTRAHTHRQSYKSVVTGHSSTRLMMNGKKQERDKKIERREAWKRERASEEAVFHSHLTNGCHWWIQIPHHSSSHQPLCCISTEANEISTGLLYACVYVCVFCICMHVLGCVKRSMH